MSAPPAPDLKAKAALLARALFEGLAPKDIEWLASLAETKIYAKGQTVFHQGEEARNLYVVESGLLKIYTLSSNGGQNVLSLFGPGTHVAIVALFDYDAYPANCEALEETRLIVLPAPLLAQRLAQEPAIAMAMLKRAGARLDMLVETYLELKTLSPLERLARHLIGLAGKDKGPARIKLPYQRTVLAAAIGIAPENLSRAFQRLAALGVRSEGNVIAIDDLARLKKPFLTETA